MVWPSKEEDDEEEKDDSEEADAGEEDLARIRFWNDKLLYVYSFKFHVALAV